MTQSIHAQQLAQLVAGIEHELGLVEGALIRLGQLTRALIDQIALQEVNSVDDGIEAAHAEIRALDGHQQQFELNARAKGEIPQRIELSRETLDFIDRVGW